MDKKSNGCAGRPAKSASNTESKFANWAKAVQLSVLEFVGRRRISGHDEIQLRHLSLRSMFQPSLAGDPNEQIECSAYLP
jgi:hypothetical protein